MNQATCALSAHPGSDSLFRTIGGSDSDVGQEPRSRKRIYAGAVAIEGRGAL